jgi:hypothetical protein
MIKHISNEPGALRDYDEELRGPAQNCYGGRQVQRVRAFPGGTYGPAGPCRIYSDEEKAEVAKELARKGLLDDPQDENRIIPRRPRAKRSSRRRSGVRR